MIMGLASGVRIGRRLADGHGTAHGGIRPAVGMNTNIGRRIVLVGDLGSLLVADGDVVGLSDHDHAIASVDQYIPKKEGNRQIQVVLGLSRVGARSSPRDLGFHGLGSRTVGLLLIASLKLVTGINNDDAATVGTSLLAHIVDVRASMGFSRVFHSALKNDVGILLRGAVLQDHIAGIQGISVVP